MLVISVFTFLGLSPLLHADWNGLLDQAEKDLTTAKDAAQTEFDKLQNYQLLIVKLDLAYSAIIGGYIIVKKKLLTTNSDIACLVGFGGLATIACFAIFLPEYAIYLSIAAFILPLWGMLSLTQMGTSGETERVEKSQHVNRKPHNRKNKQKLTTAAVLILLWGVLLFSATILVNAIQIEPTTCEPDRINSGCFPREDKPICPKLNLTPRCPLDAAGQSEQ